MGIDPSSDGFYEAYTKVQHTFKRVRVTIPVLKPQYGVLELL